MPASIRSLSRFLLCSVLFGVGLSGMGCGGQPPTASLNATWVLVSAEDADPDTASPQPCATLGATTVRIQVTPGDDYDFDCQAYSGATMTFDAGYYEVQVIAFGSFGTVLDAAEFDQLYAYGPTKIGDLRFKVR